MTTASKTPASNKERLERTGELCAAMSLTAIGDQYVIRAEDSAHKKQTFTDCLANTLEAEHALRLEQSRQIMLKLATLPTVNSLEELDYEAAPGLPKAKIQELSGLAFVERKENVILLGPSGCGKKHVAIGMAIRATQRNWEARFITAPDLMLQLEKAARGAF